MSNIDPRQRAALLSEALVPGRIYSPAQLRYFMQVAAPNAIRHLYKEHSRYCTESKSPSLEDRIPDKVNKNDYKAMQFEVEAWFNYNENGKYKNHAAVSVFIPVKKGIFGKVSYKYERTTFF